ncbi:MAG: HNH endonuclease [Sphingobium sp.]|jgi:hypothetical protein|uniref:HNH endonuclease signature motif containing protein n=1 Tax=Sphingobium sp. TaxID=1912891 RepID=UPI00185A4A6B|nr:HNH endonuclease [Sphingobium sp.]
MAAGRIHPCKCTNCGRAYFVTKPKLARSRFCSRNCRSGIEYRINRTDSCWHWLGGKDAAGYGVTRRNSKTIRVHNLVYEQEVGLIPQGLELDHLCRNKSCCNPGHLEPVTRLENNVRRPIVVDARAASHCPNGHLWTEANTYRNPRSNSRVCRACSVIAVRKYRQRKDV